MLMAKITNLRPQLTCENIRFSSLFGAGDVSQEGTTFLRAKRRPHRRRARRNGCFRGLGRNRIENFPAALKHF